MEEKSSGIPFWINLLYHYLVIVSIFSLYIAGTIFVSIVLIEIIFKFFAVFINLYAMIYSSGYYVLSLFENLFWIIYSFGGVVFLMIIILKLYKGFFKTITAISSRFSIEKKLEFYYVFSSPNSRTRVLIGLICLISGTGVFWIFVELINFNLFAYSPFFFFYSILIMIPPLFKVWVQCFQIVVHRRRDDIKSPDASQVLESDGSRDEGILYILKQFLDPAGLLDFVNIYEFLDNEIRLWNGFTIYHKTVIFCYIFGAALQAYSIYIGNSLLYNFPYNAPFTHSKLFQFIPMMIYFLLLPVLLVFHFGNAFRKINPKEEEHNTNSKIDNEHDDSIQNIALEASLKYVPLFYLLLTICFFGLAFMWGVLWVSPNDTYANKEIVTFHNSANYTYDPIPSQFCSMTTNSLSITQISAIPSLMYFLNNGKSYSTPISVLQSINLKETLRIIFPDNSGDVIVNLSSLTEWGVQIIVPIDDPTTTKDHVTIQVYSSYRTPFDWAMFTELFVQRMFSKLIESLIPGYSLASSALDTFLINTRSYLSYLTETSSTAAKIALQLYFLSETNKPDIIVGQGLGGYFAKYVAAKGGMKTPSFAFDSIHMFGTLNSAETKNISSDSIVNVYSNGLFSEYEDLLNLNFLRPGPKFFWDAPDSFFSFCSTVAQCATNKNCHSHCLQTCSDFNLLLEKYGRQ